MKDFNLNGYSLSLSKSGNMSLVKRPPWFFGGDLIEIICEADKEAVEQLLPKPLKIVKNKILVSLTMVDMTSAADIHELLENPEKSQYKEFLVKIYCEYENRFFWYVPVSWVTTDFSLLRGFLMGFGKRIGNIHITRAHLLNPLNNKPNKGASVVGICNSNNDINVKIKLTLKSQELTDPFAGTGMLVMKHFPGEKTPIIHELAELKVDEYKRDNYWLADGKLLRFESEFEEIKNLNLRKVIFARKYIEGFKLLGTKKIYDYEKK